MNGAEILVKTALRRGVDVCFANPGTTEMPVVEAFDKVPGMRPVLCVFEGVCTGAADGYGRMAGKPAMVLLHLGPGLANGISNLHNARRARTPVFTVVGEHATWHRGFDPPLAMDIEATAGTVSGWHKTSSSSQDIEADVSDAIGASRDGQVATLILPYDLQLEDVSEKNIEEIPLGYDPVDRCAIDLAARLLRSRSKAALVLGGRALGREGLMKAARIKAACGCDLIAETFPALMDRGEGLPDVPRIPYLPEMAMSMLSQYRTLVFAGTRKPVTFFGYKNVPGSLIETGQETASIGGANQDILEVLETLAAELGAMTDPPRELLAGPWNLALPKGKLDGEKICTVLAALQPEGAIVVEEAITNSLFYHPLSAGSKPFTLLTLTGGSLGQGPPCATGAAIACPGRQVINFQADGAALYTIQALWTQAKLGLNVVTLICSNRSYDILKLELNRLGTLQPGPSAGTLLDLSGMDWVKTGEGFGVPSTKAETAEELADGLSRALQEEGPKLIEMVL